jgi:SAM-dependent methyltransferase
MKFGRLKTLVPSWLSRKRPGKGALIGYWEKRARDLGARAVLDVRHTAEERECILEQQQSFLFPLLTRELTPEDKTLLDFGCGPGRFTGPLADLTGGHVVGVDPIKMFLDLAPAHPRTEYRLLLDGRIPLAEESVDVVWTCLVLGGIPDDELASTVNEVCRVLKVGGFLFLVENTHVGIKSQHWFSRSIDDYKALFKSVNLVHLDGYWHLGQRVSVFAGRKNRGIT